MAEKVIMVAVEKQRNEIPLVALQRNSETRQSERSLVDDFRVFEDVLSAERKAVVESNAKLNKEIASLQAQTFAPAATAEQIRALNQAIADKQAELQPIPDRRMLIEDFVDALSPTTPAETATARASANIYLSQSLENNTHSIIQDGVLEELGVASGQDTKFSAFATEQELPTFEDVLGAASLDLRGEELQTQGRRPGHPIPNSDTFGDIYNLYKITENRPRLASLRVLKPSQGFGDANVIGPPTENQAGFSILFETNEFLLQATNEQVAEKFQIQETFGEPIIFAFGSQREIFTYAGILLNTENFQWKNKWYKNYDEIVRASRAIEEGARAYLTYDDVIREGHILNTAIRHSVENLNHVMFSFSMYITRRIYIGNLSDLDNDGQALRRQRETQERQKKAEGSRVIYTNNSLEIPTLTDSSTLSPTPVPIPYSGATLSNTRLQSLEQDMRTYIETQLLTSNRTALRQTFLNFKASDIIGRADKGGLFDLFPNMPAIGG